MENTTFAQYTYIHTGVKYKGITTLMAARSSLINLSTSFSTSGDSRSYFFCTAFLKWRLSTFFTGSVTATQTHT